MTDAEYSALPGADPMNEGHTSWAVMVLANMLLEEGHPVERVTAALVAAAQAIGRDAGLALPVAVIMEQAAIALVQTSDMTRN